MAQIHRLGSFAPAAFAAICTVLSAAGVPGAALSAAGGLVFGPWQGMGLSGLGTTAGSIFLFLGGRKTRFSGIPDPGFWAIFLARLSPVVPFAPIAYAAGLTRMSLGRFAAASAAGAPLCAWLYAMIGSSAMAWPVTFAGWVIHLTGLAATIGGLWLLSKAFRREES